MSTEPTQNILAFRRFLDAEIASGNVELTPEQSVELWRARQDELEESVAAVEEALRDLDAGDCGVPLQQFVDDFRHQHQIDPNA